MLSGRTGSRPNELNKAGLEPNWFCTDLKSVWNNYINLVQREQGLNERMRVPIIKSGVKQIIIEKLFKSQLLILYCIWNICAL